MRRRMLLPAALLLFAAAEARAGDGVSARPLAGLPARPVARPAAGADGIRPYEGAASGDERFGYLEFGPELVLPLGGREGGAAFSLTLGVHVLLTGENLRLFDETGDPLVIGFLTFTTSF